jgi:SAM-dependent methyltransferase
MITRQNDKSGGRSIATEFTFEFVQKNLPRESRILEVGCGLGHLAEKLASVGHEVMAIDSEVDQVHATRARGLKAEQIEIEKLDEGNFDAILFTRSLHHIHSLPACLDAAKVRLKSDGKLIVEDFGFDLVDEKTAVWFQGLKNSVATFLGKDEWPQPIENSLKNWQKHHADDHELHAAATLVSVIRARFPEAQVERDLPYLFRYFIGPMASGDFIGNILEWENQIIKSGAIRGIGLRIVASKAQQTLVS